MASIVINAIAHRAACNIALCAAELEAYDEGRNRVFAKIKEAAHADGFGFEIDEQGCGGASYRVTDEADESDLRAAHEFMQSPAADFWSIF